MEYNQLKASIAAVIKTNNRKEITGQLLQNVLFQMTNVIGENLQLAGFATPLTDPHEPDQNLFYITDQGGVYPHFDNLTVDDGLTFLMWKNGEWTSHTVGVVTQEWVDSHYVSIEFFRSLFRAYDSAGLEILPNNNPEEALPTVVDNIKAMVGFWTEQYISALGQQTGGGGGGGATSLDELSDVFLTNPSLGQALVFTITPDHPEGIWVNQTIQAGTDMATVWAALAGNTTQQINISHLTDALADYATKTYVDQNFITVAYFDRLFRAYNGSTLVSHNDVTSTIDNIKAMFGFWTEQYLSALGNNSGGGGQLLALSNMADVTLTTPIADKQVLTFDAATQKWVNGNGGASSIATLTDVTLTSLQNGQTLLYDSTTSKWHNSALKTINGYSILGSGNIEISGTGGGTRWLDAYVSGRPNTINWLYGDDRLRYFIVSDNVPGTPPMGNSMGLHFSWDNTGGYEAQMAIGHNDHRRIQFRCMNIGTWMEWSTVQDSSHMIQITLESDRQVLMDLCNYSANPYGLIVSSTNSGALMMQSKRRGSSTEFFTLALNHEGGNVGVGTIEPVVKLHVIGAGRFGTTDDGIYVAASNTGQESEFGCIERISSGQALFLNYYNSGNVNICVGGGRVGIGDRADAHKLYVNGNIYSSQYGLFGGTAGIIIGGSWDSNPQYYGCIERAGDLFSNLYLQYYSSGSIIMCYGGGSIGIGVNNPSYKLHVAGTIYATGAITALSDARKKDITGEAGISVEQIAHAPAVQFLWKDKERRKDGQQVGTLAQYWQTVLPEVVMDKGGELSMQYGVAALVSSIIIARKVANHEVRIDKMEKWMKKWAEENDE